MSSPLRAHTEGRLRAVALAATLLLAGSAVGAPSAASQSSDCSFQALASFEAQIVVRAGGEVEVTETLRPRLSPGCQGIYRTIPVEYRMPSGFKYDLLLEVVRVTDDEGRELRYDVSREGSNRKVKIWVPYEGDPVRTAVLRYRADRALRFFEDYDELYWNVTGTEWPVPIERARAWIVLPQGVEGVRAQAFTGAYGSTDRGGRVEAEGNRLRFAADELGFREGLTADVAWEPGVVERPGAVEKAGWFLRANWILLIPMLAFGGMFWLWSARGKDPDPGSIVARWEPPADLSPAEVGVLADSSPDMRDITATVVDLAVRGYLRIEEEEDSKILGLIKDRDYVFELLVEREAWSELRPHEEKLLDAMFGGRVRYVRLSDLEEEFYKDLPDLKERLLDTLVEHGFFRRRPDRVKLGWIVGGIAVAAPILALGLGLGWKAGLAPVSVVLAGVLTGAVVLGFGWYMPAPTLRGARVRADVLGLEEFLERVEEDRFRRMITGPEMFEKLLPYAMALGVERKWAKAFEDIYREPPEWYAGSDWTSFHAGVLASDLSRMSTATAGAFASSPRSSGGSGFSGGGGGFSGGGFGGGGGGAF